MVAVERYQPRRMLHIDPCEPIHLSEKDLAYGVSIGVARQLDAIRRGREDVYGCTPATGWQSHIEGALTEYAVSQVLGIRWDGAVGNIRAGDVGGYYEVRSTWRTNGHLLLHPEDPDNRPFILVTGANGRYILRGWLYGYQGKVPAYWGDPYKTRREAYWVPQHALSDMWDLP